MTDICDVSDALWNLTEMVKFRRVEKGVEDFEAVEGWIDRDTFPGLLTPLSPQRVAMKREGERDWKWLNLVTQKALATDDIVYDEGNRRYRVMSKNDWKTVGNYNQYELVEGPS